MKRILIFPHIFILFNFLQKNVHLQLTVDERERTEAICNSFIFKLICTRTLYNTISKNCKQTCTNSLIHNQNTRVSITSEIAVKLFFVFYFFP